MPQCKQYAVYRHVYTHAKYIINSLLFYVAVYNNTCHWSDFELQLIKQRWPHLLNLSAKDDCIFLTQEYRLKEFSAVILQQQFIYYFNTTMQTVCSIGMYIQGHVKYIINSLLFMLLYIIIHDQTFSFNWLSKDDYIFLTCQQKMTASF